MFFLLRLLRKIELFLNINEHRILLDLKPSDIPVLISIALSSWAEPKEYYKAIDLLFSEPGFPPAEVCKHIVKALKKVGDDYTERIPWLLSKGLRHYGEEGAKATIELLRHPDVRVRRIAARGIIPTSTRDAKVDPTIVYNLTLIALKERDDFIRTRLAADMVSYLHKCPKFEPHILKLFEAFTTKQKIRLFLSLKHIEKWSDNVIRVAEKFALSEDIAKNKTLNWAVMEGVLEKGLMVERITHHVLENLKDFPGKLDKNESDRIHTVMSLCPLIQGLVPHGVDFSPYVQRLAVSFKLSKYRNTFVDAPGDYGLTCLYCLRKMGPMALEKLKEQPEDPSWKQELDYVHQELCNLE